MPDSGIKVHGLRELQRAFALAEKETRRRLTASLKDVAEPVRADAEWRATNEIPKVGMTWSRMRVGVTRSSVYVAPRARGAKRARDRRPNFADILLGRAMEPALAANEDRIADDFDDMLTDVANLWERA